jgi:ribonucleoside-diphosphate reductase alpha chain
MDSWYVDEFARNIMNSKYIGDFTDPFSYYESLAKLVALGDKSLEKSFFRLLWDKRFSPGGRILAYAGRTQSSMSLMNCTTHSVEGDNLEDIANAAYTIMRASSRGQGIGINLSTLRPKDAPVNNAARTSTGAISFMEMFNGIGATIGQEGRRAALLFTMRIDHPDIWREDGYDFLNIKRMPGKVENANISVLLTDDFMKAVAMDQPWYLRYHGVSGKGSFDIGREVRARDLFQAIAASTLASAEPGVLYWDNTVRMSNSDLFGEQWKVVGMNACTEATLDQEGICDLGSMNLLYYVRDPFTEYSWFDHSSFRRDVGTAIEFLDNVLTVEMMTNNHATERQRESIENLRRIGLGVMGLADTFAAVGIRYGEQDSFRLAEEIFRSMRNAAYAKSVSLAKEKGPAKVWLDALRSGSVSEIVNSGFYATLSEAGSALLLMGCGM